MTYLPICIEWDTAAEIGLTVGDTPVSPGGWCMGNKTKSLNGEHYKKFWGSKPVVVAAAQGDGKGRY